MPINFSDIDILLANGLDERTDEKVSQGFSKLENAQWVDEGSISKRWGYSNVSTSSLGNHYSSSITTLSPFDIKDAFTGLAIRNSGDTEELIAFGSSSIWSYDSTSNNWINKGDRRRCSVKSFDHPGSTDSRISASTAKIGNIQVTAWASTTQNTGSADFYQQFSVIDTNTGHVLLANQPLRGPSRTFTGIPKVIPITNAGTSYFHILYIDRPNATSLGLYDLIMGLENPWQPFAPVRIGETGAVSGSRVMSAGAAANSFDAMYWESNRFGNCVLSAHISGTSIWVCATDLVGQPVFNGQLNITGSGFSDIMGLQATPDAIQIMALGDSALRPISVIPVTTDVPFVNPEMHETPQLPLTTQWQDSDGRIAFNAVAFATG